MHKWSLRPDPGPHDSDRYALFVQGDMKSLTPLIKKFGSMCGRPMKIRHPEGFNFRMHLHGLTQPGRERVFKYLDEAAPGACADRTSVAPEKEPLTADVPALTIPEPLAPAAASEPEPAPPATPPPSASEPAPAPVPEAVSAPEPTPAPTPAPEPAGPPAAAEPAPAPAPQPAAEDPAAPSFGLRRPIDPKRDLDSLLVGAFNRFAHAAATSVIGSPGTMYNPFFVFGGPGGGKSHVLHAVAGALGQSLGEAVLTSGSGLALAANRAAAQGKTGEFEAFMGQAKALLIDDAHLLAISEGNQGVLGRILQACFSRNAQVVMASVYPPRALGFIEEALKISLSKGWAVDMKLPNSTIRAELIGAALARQGAVVEPELVKKLVEELGANYGKFPRIAARWGALARIYQAAGRSPVQNEIYAHLMAPGARLAPGELPTPAELESARSFQPPIPGAGAGALAVFFPKGQEGMAAWTLASFHRVAAQFGVNGSFRCVLRESYDPDQPFVPFQIGEACRRCAARRALVLGPAGESRLAGRVGEFAHAVRHVLEDGGAAMGWIPFNEAAATRPFLAAHLDMLAAGRA
ncbi:MAG: DnaA/Hda family protein [Elusimicrobia bacterium]|nr:DnaA/Hda family protein [Elusimicrobiota bacterium]